jgi:hypothetical protein
VTEVSENESNGGWKCSIDSHYEDMRSDLDLRCGSMEEEVEVVNVEGRIRFCYLRHN